MRTLSKPLQYLAALLLSILSVPAADESALRSLIDAEKTFAATSLERGIRDSFLQFFAENSIIFAPEPKNGKKFYTYYQDKGRRLSWRPIFATIAGSGELGVTTGPWELAKSKAEAAPIAHGDFVSVWRKQLDRSWKVIVDVGVDHGAPGVLSADVQLLPPPAPMPHEDVDLARAALKRIEETFTAGLHENAGAAILAAASDEIRVLRQNALPAVGRSAAKVMLDADSSRTTRIEEGGGVSDAADLAYRYGAYSRESERGYYLSVWRAEPGNQWKILLDLQKPAAQD